MDNYVPSTKEIAYFRNLPKFSRSSSLTTAQLDQLERARSERNSGLQNWQKVVEEPKGVAPVNGLKRKLPYPQFDPATNRPRLSRRGRTPPEELRTLIAPQLHVPFDDEDIGELRLATDEDRRALMETNVTLSDAIGAITLQFQKEQCKRVSVLMQQVVFARHKAGRAIRSRREEQKTAKVNKAKAEAENKMVRSGLDLAKAQRATANAEKVIAEAERKIVKAKEELAFEIKARAVPVNRWLKESPLEYQHRLQEVKM